MNKPRSPFLYRGTWSSKSDDKAVIVQRIVLHLTLEPSSRSWWTGGLQNMTIHHDLFSLISEG